MKTVWEWFKKHEVIIVLLGLLGIFILPWLFTRPWFGDFTNLGQVGDTIGGTTAPFIGLLSAWLVYKAFKQQVDTNKDERNKYREEKIEQQIKDDFLFKFSSYKDSVREITNEMLFPWKEDEKVVSGKLALARWYKILETFESTNQSNLSHLLGQFLKHQRTNLRFGRNHTSWRDEKRDDFRSSVVNDESIICGVNSDFLQRGNGTQYYYQVEKVGFFENEIETVQQYSAPDDMHLILYSDKVMDRLSPFFCETAMLDELYPYFRSVYNVINSQHEYAEKYPSQKNLTRNNIEFFCSQLNNSELKFIGLFILFNTYGKEKLKPLVIEYKLFSEYLPKEHEIAVEQLPNLIYLLYKLPDYGRDMFR